MRNDWLFSVATSINWHPSHLNTNVFVGVFRNRFERISVNYWLDTLGEMSNFCLRLFTIHSLPLPLSMVLDARRILMRTEALIRVRASSKAHLMMTTNTTNERTNERASERPSINKMKQQRGHSLHLFNTGNKTKFNLKDLFTIYLSCYNHKQMKMFKCYRFPQIESFDSINVLHFRSASAIIEHITCSN